MKIKPERNNKIIIRIQYNQDVSVYPLRHSFATHLLENGINLRYIQELLGYKSSKTTEIYTYVSTKNLSAIKNLLDNLLREGGTWNIKIKTKNNGSFRGKYIQTVCIHLSFGSI